MAHLGASANAMTAQGVHTSLAEALHRFSFAEVGNVAPVERLGIPPLNLNDGPQGFRASDKLKGTSTAWPSGMSMAATWDEAAALERSPVAISQFVSKSESMTIHDLKITSL